MERKREDSIWLNRWVNAEQNQIPFFCVSILYKWPSFKIENKQFQKQNESWVPLPKGVPKNFLIKIKRSNRRHLHTISADGEGFTLWNKNLSPPAKCSGHHPLWCEIIWKGPQRLFWFLSGTFLGQEKLILGYFKSNTRWKGLGKCLS